MSTPTRRKTRVLNISVPPEMYADIEEIASVENRTKSELIYEYQRRNTDV